MDGRMTGQPRDPSTDRRPSARSFWGGRVLLIILAAMASEYSYARHALLIGTAGLIAGVVAAGYALLTRRRRQGR